MNIRIHGMPYTQGRTDGNCGVEDAVLGQDIVIQVCHIIAV